MIDRIARMITDDPDIFLEDIDVEPINPEDIKTPVQASAQTQLTDQGDQRQEEQNEIERKRRQTIEPIMQNADKTINNMSTALQRNQAQQNADTSQMTDLNRELTGLRALLQNLGKLA